jgi:hypothetical protein
MVISSESWHEYLGAKPIFIENNFV